MGIIKPMIRSNICINAHPIGCAKDTERQIDYVLSQKAKRGTKAVKEGGKGPKNVLVLGCSTGYGLASRIAAAFEYGADTIGVSFEKEATATKGGTPGWYNNLAFDRAATKAGLKTTTFNMDAFSDECRQAVIDEAKKWGVQTFYLDKTRWNLGLYYIPSDVNQIHVQNNRIAAEFASEMFSGISASAVSISVQEIKGFGDAYQKARTQGMDYFVILGVDEGSRDITLEYSVYSARTGTKIKENSLYNTGNYRYSSVFRRFRDEVLSLLTVRANIIDRDGKILLADIGRSENIRNGAVFDIVRKNAISTASSGAGVTYRESDVLGTFTVTLAGEEVSEGVLEYKGFYDRINRGDELVLISLPQSEEQNAREPGDTAAPEPLSQVPAATANGEALNKRSGLTAEDLGVRRTPSFIDLIRSIY